MDHRIERKLIWQRILTSHNVRLTSHLLGILGVPLVQPANIRFFAISDLLMSNIISIDSVTNSEINEWLISGSRGRIAQFAHIWVVLVRFKRSSPRTKRDNSYSRPIRQRNVFVDSFKTLSNAISHHHIPQISWELTHFSVMHHIKSLTLLLELDHHNSIRSAQTLFSTLQSQNSLTKISGREELLQISLARVPNAWWKSHGQRPVVDPEIRPHESHLGDSDLTVFSQDHDTIMKPEDSFRWHPLLLVAVCPVYFVAIGCCVTCPDITLP